MTLYIACLAAMCFAAVAAIAAVLWDCRQMNKRAKRHLEGLHDA